MGETPHSGRLSSMAETLRPISRDDLWRLIESGADFVLVDALPPMSYAVSHLPGAISIPPERVADLARRRIPDLRAPVVVYCSSSTCDSSNIVASRLIELGYRDVRHYAEGKSDWVQAGLPFEGGVDRFGRCKAEPAGAGARPAVAPRSR